MRSDFPNPSLTPQGGFGLWLVFPYCSSDHDPAPQPGDVAQISPEHDCPLSRHSSADGFDLGPAKGREAVHDGDADLDFGGLAGGVS